MKNIKEYASFNIFLVITFLLLTVLSQESFSQLNQDKTFKLCSPDQSVSLVIGTDKALTYSLEIDGEVVISPSVISMKTNNAILGDNPEVVNITNTSIDEVIKAIVPEKFIEVRNNCNEMIISFKNNFALVLRAYNNGIAYRFKTEIDDKVKIFCEEVNFNFSKGTKSFYPQEKQFFSHNERAYKRIQLDTVKSGKLASLPVLMNTKGYKLLIAESSLKDYPGMWIKTGANNSLAAVFPHYPLESELEDNSDRDMPVTKYAEYLAKTSGTRSFPWRIIGIAREDKELLTNQLVYQLGEPLMIDDPTWIKPGKVAWDWWNANNIYGVDFQSGINTETYKYYIDFAAKFGIEYIILDEGWYKLGNLLDIAPDINIEELISYGNKKNVKLILWVVWKTLDDQLEKALNKFKEWGVAGIKVDFMQRDDQEMVNYYWKIAEEAAKRKLLVDFHGAYKPAGIRRAYPNVITREGVKGLENCKWSKEVTPTHDLTLPFIRMAAGPMDYTPGAMINAQPENFYPCYPKPMSMGTRAHQVAMYVIYESPLQMLADNPSNYLKERECTEFISQIPTTWDKTIVTDAKVGEYIITARKHKDTWYLGAMTNEEPREFTIDFSFLDNAKYSLKIIQDGINADRYASDYKLVKKVLTNNDSIAIKMAPGGGWAAIIQKD